MDIDKSLGLLSITKQKTDSGTITPEVVRNNHEILTEVSQKIEQFFSGIKTYRYPQYRENKTGDEELERMCGTIIQK